MLLLNSQYPLQSMVMSATRYGVWSANIHTTRDVTVQVGDTVQVQCWDLTLIGRIRSGGLYTGTGRYQVVGGGGNWGRIIPHTPSVRISGVVGIYRMMKALWGRSCPSQLKLLGLWV